MDQTIYDIDVEKIDGSAVTLKDHAGKVLLVVNVASKCGFTPQYEALEKLHETYRDRGFAVLGFPANDFGAQEPGSNAEIQSFCTTNFGVEFPMFAKVTVTGDAKHPLYAHLTSAYPETEARDRLAGRLRGYGMEPSPAPEVLWNFEKFLVGRDGQVVRRFASDTAPDADELVNAIEAELERSSL
jgi:glutathione peroxidase